MAKFAAVLAAKTSTPASKLMPRPTPTPMSTSITMPSPTPTPNTTPSPVPTAAPNTKPKVASDEDPPRITPELDGAARTAVLLAPPAPPPPPAIAPPPTFNAQHLEFVEKAAFWGDGQRGVARLRFGKSARGGLAGASVMLEHDGDTVHVRVEGDPELAERLATRIAADESS